MSQEQPPPAPQPAPVPLRPAPRSERETGLWEGLTDFRLRKYVTRKVNAWLYAIEFWLGVLLAPFFMYYGYIWLRNCGGWVDYGYVCTTRDFAWVAIPGTLLSLVFYLLMIRLVAEYSVAIVVVAENTDRLANRD